MLSSGQDDGGGRAGDRLQLSYALVGVGWREAERGAEDGLAQGARGEGRVGGQAFREKTVWSLVSRS